MSLRTSVLAPCTLLCVFLMSGPAFGATFNVNQTTDSTDINPGDGLCDSSSAVSGEQCTLRAAVMEANALAGADTISLPAGTITMTRSDASGEDAASTGDYDVTDDVTIYGQGTGATIIDAAGLDRIFDVDPSNGATDVVVLLEDLTVRAGDPSHYSNNGGGIRNQGDLSLNAVRVQGNTVDQFSTADRGGGGIWSAAGVLSISGSEISGNAASGLSDNGGGLHARSGTVTITNTDFINNTADNIGGAIILGDVTFSMAGGSVDGNSAGLRGGGIYGCTGTCTMAVNGTLFENNVALDGSANAIDPSGGAALYLSSTADVTIDDATISTNHTNIDPDFGNSGLVGFAGGVLVDGSVVTIRRTTFENNSVDGSGGALAVFGGGSDVELVNSTISNSEAGYDGGAAWIDTGGSVDFSSVTVVSNQAGVDDIGYGGGVNVEQGSATFRNTILADNQDEVITGGADDDLTCASGATSDGYNLIESGGSCSLTGDTATNLSAAPMLLALADNGGATSTHASQTGSPVIDAGNPAGCVDSTGATLTNDQRGEDRAIDGLGDGTDRCDIGAFEVGERGVLVFSAARYDVGESDGSVTVTLQRQGGTGNTTSVDYATSDGTATAGSDYTATSGTENWLLGNADMTFSIPITADMVSEPDETIDLTLSNPGNGAILGAQNTAMVNIIDDDASPGEINFSAATYTVDEDGASVTITATRTGGTDGAVSVDYATFDDTATAGADYTTATGTIDWADGDGADKAFTVAITDDAIYEGDETVDLAFSNATGGATLGAVDTAALTIVDDDPPPSPGTLGFTVAMVDVAEDARTMMATVSRTGGTEGLVTVDVATRSDTAIGGEDFVESSDTLTWPDADGTDRSYTIEITNDAQTEGDEVFQIVLSAATGGATLGTATIDVTILDDESMPPEAMPGTLGFVLTEAEVSEGDGAVALSVARTDGVDGAVAVDWNVEAATAAIGEDVEDGSGTLSWADGEEGPKSISVTILDDAEVEDPELFDVVLSGPTAMAMLGEDRATVTITDDDAPPTNNGTNNGTNNPTNNPTGSNNGTNNPTGTNNGTATDDATNNTTVGGTDGDTNDGVGGIKNDESGGCGCAAAGGAADASWLLLLAFVFGMRRRRRS